jgi:cell wall-associated NlpC family hydrolase
MPLATMTRNGRRSSDCFERILLLKEAYQPSAVRKARVAFAGTATLAAFLAAAATTPAQAARHHHHHHDSELSSSAAGDSSYSSEHHRRHRHHHSDSDDNELAQTTSRHHRHHHHDDSEDVASNFSEHHRHHHRHDDEIATSSSDRYHRDFGYVINSEPVHYGSRQQRWLAHVAWYQAHLANISQEHEERLAMVQAHEDNIVATDRALASGNIVRAAEAFQGTRYVMGGTSRSGFDCSGFTRYILGRSAGIDLPRTAEEQYYTGEHIDKEDLRPGDLVFFQNTYRRGISHVGMYIGDDKFVHACNPREGVTVSSLDQQYYINHWAGARRVLNLRSESGDE